MSANDLQARAEAVVREADPGRKCRAAAALYADLEAGAIALRHPRPPRRFEVPGRSERRVRAFGP